MELDRLGLSDVGAPVTHGSRLLPPVAAGAVSTVARRLGLKQVLEGVEGESL